MSAMLAMALAAAVSAVPPDEPEWPEVTPVYYEAETGTPPMCETATNDFSQPISVSVRKVAGHPVVHINGEPFPFFAGLTCGGWKRPDKLPRLGNLPHNVVVARYPQQLWHPKDGEYRLDLLERFAQNVVNCSPNAYILWDLMVFPPDDFRERYPDEMAKDSAGETKQPGWCLNYSYSSPHALAEMQEMCERAIRHLEASPFANRIIGYRYCSGYGPEWIGWPFLANDRSYDYSMPSRNAFLAYVKKHFPELKDPHVPTKAERMAVDNPDDILWDRFKHLNAYAYTEFAGWERANCALQLGRHLRRTLKDLGKRKLVGTYYGYTCHGNYCGSNTDRCHTALQFLLDNNADTLDFLMSPQNYGPRNLGETTGDMKPFATMEAHGIMPIIEDDTRTHCVTKGEAKQLDQWSFAKTPAQSLAMIERGAAVAICRRMFPYFCTILSETEFDFPELKEPGERMLEAVRRSVEKKVERRAEVALVASERSIAATPVVWHYESTGRTRQRYSEDGRVTRSPEKIAVYHGEVYDYIYDRFARAGAPVDQLLAEDLKNNPGQYRLYVFMDLFRYDRDVLEAVRRIRARGATVLWLYAPGYLGGDESCSRRCMQELTGIEFGEMLNAGIAGGVKMKEDGRFMGMRDGRVARMFYPLRPAETLGTYENGRPGLARFRIDGGESWFYGGWQMDQKFIAMLEDRAGVHRYCDSNDPMEANDRFFTLHARSPGVKRIRLPRKARRIENVFTGETVATDTDAFEFTAKLHETYLFEMCEPDGRDPWEGEWIEVTPKNGVWDDYYSKTDDPNDCSFRFRVSRHTSTIGVEAYVRDDSVMVDDCPEHSISCETWKDDCLEVFFDGDNDRNPNTRGPEYETNPTPCNAGGEYAVAANGSSQSDYASSKKSFGKAWGGYVSPWMENGERVGTHYRLRFRYECLGRPTPSPDEPVTFGFTICVHDDDDGGTNDHALYWKGNPKIPYADESAFGTITFPGKK